jgi:hypothetical protein
VWIHPPKDLELSVDDELFVLCEINPHDVIEGGKGGEGNNAKVRTNLDLLGGGGSNGNKLFKNEDKKLQKDSMQKLMKLNGML